ncbi:ThuA domain-containing protein [Tellurirhabdus rosea]|uniref:ThuA domain-containing protein n=1 Tax=Tellurirhabdus rosea TaxID=2674997 RepID=UPI002251962D|nr:ThuA domain-containing protein [Tellurirhabdus rosea]
MKRFLTVLLTFLTLSTTLSQAGDGVNWKKVKVLVYTKNGKGYVHDNIPFAVQCIQQLGREHGFAVDVSDQPTVFTEANLRQYTLLIFPSTNNDVFDTDEQRLQFRRYIEAGGGFVGIHSVMGTERNWTWFKRMLGGTFAWHPKFQPLRLVALDPAHPSLEGLPKIWEKQDECYFGKELAPGPTVIMAHDLTSLNYSDADGDKIRANAGTFKDLYPAVWHYRYDGGYTWCTALGHDKKDYSEPTFVRHLFQGIRFVAGQVKKVDFSRAYATSRDEAVRWPALP